METGSYVTASATNIFNSLQVIFCAAFNSDQRLNQRWLNKMDAFL